jgi:membrane-associated phospholipid phosphatase
VADFDAWVDARFEPWRGRPLPDRLAAAVSFLGDHGLIWFLILLARMRRPGPRRRSALRAVTLTGAVVPVVNASLKLTVARRRPEAPTDVPGLRRPTTASFPSGHTLAAWCAATLLAEDDPWAGAYYALAAAISLSRLQVRHHHGTDVVAGSVIGMLLGRLGRLVWPLSVTPQEALGGP